MESEKTDICRPKYLPSNKNWMHEEAQITAEDTTLQNIRQVRHFSATQHSAGHDNHTAVIMAQNIAN